MVSFGLKSGAAHASLHGPRGPSTAALAGSVSRDLIIIVVCYGVQGGVGSGVSQVRCFVVERPDSVSHAILNHTVALNPLPWYSRCPLF